MKGVSIEKFISENIAVEIPIIIAIYVESARSFRSKNWTTFEVNCWQHVSLCFASFWLPCNTLVPFSTLLFLIQGIIIKASRINV